MIRTSPNYGALLKLLPFLSWGRRITFDTLRHDLIAGLSGAVIALPQGVAFAMIAGLPPQYGLYTVIVTASIAGLFGSSLHMVSGPATPISIVVLGVVSAFTATDGPQYIPYVLTLTFLAGVFQLALGLARMGGLVNFISHTVVIGFTAGAAVLIAVSQLRHFFGVPIDSDASVPQALGNFIWELDNYNPYVLVIAACTLATALLVRRYRPQWPAMLVAILAGCLLCLLINGQAHGVPMIGALPGTLPPLSLPEFSVSTIRALAPGALALAMLGLIEAVSIARSLATRSHQRIDSNQEFIGQGLSNIVGSFFSCYAGSGSFTRSGINYDAGARTPLSVVLAALAVAAVMLFLAPLSAYLPMPAMAGVIMLVAWNLVDFHHIRLIARASLGETVVMVVTLFSTVFVALEFAIYAGVLLSLVLYLQRTSHPRIIGLAPDPSTSRRYLSDARKHQLLECPQLKIIRLDGSLFFGAVDHVQSALHRLTGRNADWKHVLIVGSGINFIDVAGAEMLVQEARRLRQKGGGLYLCGLKDSVNTLLRRGGYAELIGRGNLFINKEEAIRSLFKRLDVDRCSLCAQRIFNECAKVKFQGTGLMS